MGNVIDLSEGRAFVVSDLHGAWEPYCRYRDSFLDLYHHGQADYLIFLGDVIHGYGSAEQDASVPMLLDIIDLQNHLDSGTVIPILGNHEFPHIYGVTLSKGKQEFTSRFEHTMGSYRPQITEFIGRLPFWIRTAGGVLLTHAGPTTSIASREAAQFLEHFSHADLLAEIALLLQRDEMMPLIEKYLNMTAEEYDAAARYYLAVSDNNDPRYFNLLQGIIVSNLREWSILWDYFFNQCEAGISLSLYKQIVVRFLEVFSAPPHLLTTLVTGHIAVKSGYAFVTDQHLRLASWAHASPKSSGCYLLFDTAQMFGSAKDLIQFIHPIP